MRPRWLSIIGAVVVVAAGLWWWAQRQAEQPDASGFLMERKTPHFESSTPAHGDVLPAAPINVVVNFNFDLSSKSNIYITRTDAGKIGFGVGSTVIDDNQLSMRRQYDPTHSPEDWNGTYTVAYQACWPDGSCHEGRFQYKVDRRLAGQATDLRNQPEVRVNMKDIAFAPQSIRVSSGAKVTWVNDDTVEHYVNTDGHPAHTYFSDQNSRALKTGDTYSVTFTDRGVYPYHCSAHAVTMTAAVIVE